MSRLSTALPQANAQPPPELAASTPVARMADIALVRERSPFWGLTLVLGEIAERLEQRQPPVEQAAPNEQAA